MVKNNNSNYKWYILILAAIIMALVVAIPFMSMTVLFPEISEELDLSLGQIGIVWGILPLGGVLFSLLGGMLGDRFGTKLIISLACLLAGIFGAARGLSGDFFILVVTTFLFGLPNAILSSVVTKAVSIWFQGRELALSQSVLAASMALGFTLGTFLSATVFSPLFGGWRNVMYIYGAVSVVLGFLWMLTRSSPGTAETSNDSVATVPFRQAISHVFPIKNVRLLAIVLSGHAGCIQGMLGYLPTYLRGAGWTAASADSAAASFHIASLLATIPVVLLSNRLGSRKLIFYATLLMTTIGVALLSVVSGPMVWLLVIMAGVFRDGFVAVLLTALIETGGVGAQYAGTALGLIFTFSRLGVMFSPPIGNSLEYFGPSIPFLLWGFWAFIALVTSYFLEETAKRQR